MQDFAEQNCAIFDGAKEEHSLEQTDIHQRFKALFERLVEEYIESLGVSIGEFYQMVAEDTHSQEFHSGGTFAHVVNALVQFESFHEMMVDARAGDFVWGMPPLQDLETGELC